MDLIIISLSRWDGKYSSTVLSLSKVFARTHRVFYIDNPFTLKDLITGITSRQVLRRLKALLIGKDIYKTPIADTPNFIAVTPSVTVPVNWLPRGWLFDKLSALNDRIVYRAIEKTIRQHEVKEFIYFNSFNPLYGNYFPESFQPTLSVYHCVDDISKSAYVNKHGTRLEEEVMRRAGMTITTSTELKRLKSPFANQIHILPNAANVRLFRTAVFEKLVKPAEVAALPEGKEIILYIGNVCQRLDYELLVKIADSYPDRVLMMVGPISNDGYQRSGLNKRNNVVFTGARKLEELPAYLQYSHCAIIPFLCNTLTRSIYPLKINEYLSAGKPVVTTAFSVDVISFNKIIQVSNNHQDFIDNIDKAIRTDNEENKHHRVEFSACNSWEDRAEKFWKIVEEHKHG